MILCEQASQGQPCQSLGVGIGYGYSLFMLGSSISLAMIYIGEFTIVDPHLPEI